MQIRIIIKIRIFCTIDHATLDAINLVRTDNMCLVIRP